MSKENSDGFVDLGISIKEGEGAPIIETEDLFRHMCVCGGTGRGKTTYCLNILTQLPNCSLIVIDPHGELAEKVFAFYPNAKYVSKNTPLSLNPLDRKLDVSELANDLIEVINLATRITSPGQTGITVLMGRFLRTALKLGFKDLQDLADFLDYEEVRKKRKDLDAFWRSFDDRTGKKGAYVNREQRESAKRVTARLSFLLDDENLRPFLLGKNQFNIKDIIDKKQVCIFNLNGLGPFVTSFIGTLITTYIRSYYLHDAEPNPSVPSLFVIIDEIDWFLDKNYQHVLAESRKYKVGFILSFHSFAQIGYKLSQMVWANCHSKVFLGGSPFDTRNFAKIFNYRLPDRLEAFEGLVSIADECMLVHFLPPPEIPEVTLPDRINFLRDEWIEA